MSQRSLMIVIVLVLIGIFSVLVMNTEDDKLFNDSISETVNEAAEEVRDEVDDATTN